MIVTSMKSAFLIFFSFLLSFAAFSQNGTIEGVVFSEDGPLSFAAVALDKTGKGAITDENGQFLIENVLPGEYKLVVQFVGYERLDKQVDIAVGQTISLNLTMTTNTAIMDEVVVTGTLKAVNRLETPVPVEVYTPKFFQKNPTANVYEALQNVNGVRPQLNCAVCNTGDIHINGLEGAYTMVLIDGMPIVSSLSTVYGLMGIPNSLIERVEIVKGPASSLYGSEAIGGLINIITKDATNAPIASVDFFATSTEEYNLDAVFKFNAESRATVLTGLNYFRFNNILDEDNDKFTDMTLQDRFSVFQKWNFKREKGRVMSLAGRYYTEDRWGGELDWTEEFRGGSQIYGESIFTDRWEVIGSYQLPTRERLMLSGSYNSHRQNSVYGDVPYIALQNIAFGQLTWDKRIKKHDLLVGAALRYTYYDDNTPATANAEGNNPDNIYLPGIFVQNEIAFTPNHKLLLGVRYDYNSDHGNIYTPRLAYKWTINEKNVFRINSGTGFRVVNLFTEDHAALTGAREVVIEEELNPETSYNVNANFIHREYFDNGSSVSFELQGWYTYFNNLIFPDYETNTNQIIYSNLDGFGVSQGVSANVDVALANGMTASLGGSYLDVSSNEGGETIRPMLTESWMGVWAISYPFMKGDLVVDYTGNIYGPMLLPVLGENDPRSPESPVWSIQNIQATWNGFDRFQMYGGVKNLLNWTPNEGNPFLIARPDDPFDQGVEFDENGEALQTANNPYGLTFDAGYVYAPNMGVRGFLGVRYTIQ